MGAGLPPAGPAFGGGLCGRFGGGVDDCFGGGLKGAVTGMGAELPPAGPTLGGGGATPVAQGAEMQNQARSTISWSGIARPTFTAE
jgi:hypothetical protein